MQTIWLVGNDSDFECLKSTKIELETNVDQLGELKSKYRKQQLMLKAETALDRSQPVCTLLVLIYSQDLCLMCQSTSSV